MFYITLVEISNDFKRRLYNAYESDNAFKYIIELLKVLLGSTFTTGNEVPMLPAIDDGDLPIER